MERTEAGLAAAEEGWFTVSVRDAARMTSDAFGGSSSSPASACR